MAGAGWQHPDHFRGAPAGPYQPSCTLLHPCLLKAEDRVLVLLPEASAHLQYLEPATTWYLCPEAALELQVKPGKPSAVYFSTSPLQAELGSFPSHLLVVFGLRLGQQESLCPVAKVILE